MYVWFHNSKVKIEVAFLFYGIGLMELIDFQPAFQAAEIVREVKDAREVDHAFSDHDVEQLIVVTKNSALYFLITH